MDSDIDYQKLNIIADIMLENNFEPSNLFLNCMDTNSNRKTKKNLYVYNYIYTV